MMSFFLNVVSVQFDWIIKTKPIIFAKKPMAYNFRHFISVHTFTTSHTANTLKKTGCAADLAEFRKLEKHSNLATETDFLFVILRLETSGSWGENVRKLWFPRLSQRCKEVLANSVPHSSEGRDFLSGCLSSSDNELSNLLSMTLLLQGI